LTNLSLSLESDPKIAKDFIINLPPKKYQKIAGRK